MTNAERDKLLSDMAGDTKVIRELVEKHDRSLYHPVNGVCHRVDIVEERQSACPAKQALSDGHVEAQATRSAARSSWIATGVSIVMCLVAVSSVLVIPSCQNIQLAPPPGNERKASPSSK